MRVGWRIAVADDEQDTREYLTRLLPKLGHDVLCAASDGEALVEACRAAPPDLLLTDVAMPHLDGIQASRTIMHAHPVAVVLMSAHEIDRWQQENLDHVMAYLVKPVKLERLEAALAAAMHRFQVFRDLHAQSGDLQQALGECQLVLQAWAVLLSRGSPTEGHAQQELARLAATRTERLVETARSLIAATPMTTGWGERLR